MAVLSLMPKPVSFGNGREPTETPFGAIDLCCGMGGLSAGAKRLGINLVAGADLNESALRTYGKNFPEASIVTGDVCERETLDQCIRLAEMAKATRKLVVLSGPPCQGFSLAGPRDPQDPRNQVLLSIGRAVAEMQPECALIENVPPILGDLYKEHIRAFEEKLVSGGYKCHRVILNAADFGVPQTRRRAFFFVTRSKLDQDAVESRLASLRSARITVGEALAGLPSPEPRPLVYSDEETYDAVPNHFSMRHSQSVIDKIAQIPPGKGPMSYRRLHPGRQSNTLFSGHRAPPAHHSEPRSITVREAARLQGFPDSFRIYGSFANQMGQVTNSVPPPLAQAALSVLLSLVVPQVRDHA